MCKASREIGTFGLFPAVANPWVRGTAINPYAIVALPVLTTGTPTLFTYPEAVDYISCFGMMYAYSRGGIRMKVMTPASDSNLTFTYTIPQTPTGEVVRSDSQIV